MELGRISAVENTYNLKKKKNNEVHVKPPIYWCFIAAFGGAGYYCVHDTLQFHPIGAPALPGKNYGSLLSIYILVVMYYYKNGFYFSLVMKSTILYGIKKSNGTLKQASIIYCNSFLMGMFEEYCSTDFNTDLLLSKGGK